MREPSEVITQVECDALDLSIPVAQIILRCYAVAPLVRSRKLSTWCRNELEGYRNDEVPEYRLVSQTFWGHFLGPAGSQLKNQHLPSEWFDQPDLVRSVEEHKVRDGVGRIESLYNHATDKSEMLLNPMNQLIPLLKPYSGGMVCAQLQGKVDPACFYNILIQIRMRICTFVHELRRRFGNDLDMGSVQQDHVESSQSEGISIVDSIVVGAIIGGTNSNVNFNLDVVLSDLGIPQSEIELLREAMDADIDAGQGKLGERTVSWIHRAVSNSMKFTRDVAANGLGTLLAQAILKS